MKALFTAVEAVPQYKTFTAEVLKLHFNLKYNYCCTVNIVFDFLCRCQNVTVEKTIFKRREPIRTNI
jgi:hypothetical protein